MLVSVAMLVKYNEAKLNQILITGNGFNLDIDLDGEFLSIKDFSELKDIIKKLLEKN